MGCSSSQQERQAVKRDKEVRDLVGGLHKILQLKDKHPGGKITIDEISEIMNDEYVTYILKRLCGQHLSDDSVKTKLFALFDDPLQGELAIDDFTKALRSLAREESPSQHTLVLNYSISSLYR